MLLHKLWVFVLWYICVDTVMLPIVCCKQIVRESSSDSFCEVALLENGCTRKNNTVLGGVRAVSFYYLIERSMSNPIVIVKLLGGVCLWSWILLGLTVVMETLSRIVVAQLPLLHDYSRSSLYWRARAFGAHHCQCKSALQVVEFMFLALTGRVTIGDSGLMLLCLADVFPVLINRPTPPHPTPPPPPFWK